MGQCHGFQLIAPPFLSTPCKNPSAPQNDNRSTRRAFNTFATAAAASAVNGEGPRSSDAAAISLGTATTAPLSHAYVAEKTRPDFPILARTITDQHLPLVYLDSGATSQKPLAVLDAIDAYYREINSNVHRGAHALSREATAAYEHARDKVAAFIKAPTRNEIIFTSGATESINLVAQSYGRRFLSKGDEIVLTVAEHHANLVPWQLLAQEKQLQIRYVLLDPNTGGLDLTHMESLLSERTKIVGFQHVSNVLGGINPVREMVALVRAHAPQAKVVLDACQSVPHMPVDVQDLGVDFLAASGHKMCGPTGIGFLWGREALLNEMPPWKGGGEMIDQVTLQGTTYLPSPSRFEAGTPPIAQAVGLGAAVDYLTSIGMDVIEAYERELAGYLFERLKAVPGITVFGPQNGQDRVSLCAFAHETVHPSDLGTFLDVEGIAVRAGHHCCQPLHQEGLGFSHSARASLSFYNTKECVVNCLQLVQTTNFARRLVL